MRPRVSTVTASSSAPEPIVRALSALKSTFIAMLSRCIGTNPLVYCWKPRMDVDLDGLCRVTDGRERNLKMLSKPGRLR